MDGKCHQLSEILKQKGFNVTHQRMVIYKVLANTKSHPCAEDIHREIHAHYPMISLGTVYKTLEMLEKIGVIRKVNHLYESARYDADISVHGHLICKKCETIVDVIWHHPPLTNLTDKEAQGFEVDSTTVHYLGLCAQCQNSKNASSTH